MSNVTQAWLEDPASIRGILVEVTVKDLLGKYGTANTDVTLYLSNIGYTTSTADVSYLPYLTGALQTTESLSIDGGLSMSFGDIQIANTNGELDSWLDSSQFIWVNRSVQVYLGDPRWVTTNLADVHTVFELVFNGVVADTDSRARETLNIKVRDKLQRLNTPLTSNTLGTYGIWGSGQTNQDSIRPLIFGEVHNMSPLLVDPSLLEYMFTDTSIGTIISATSATGNLLTCASTLGFVLNKPVVFTGVTFGGIVAKTTYYISTIDSSTTFTISATLGGAVFTLTTAAAVTTSIMQAEVQVTTAESVIEIRYNGLAAYTDPAIYGNNNTSRPSGAVIDLTNGKFTCTSQPLGTVTASVQGIQRTIDLTTGALVEGTYTNNIAKIIALIATQYGDVNKRLSASDLDLVNLNNFAINNTAPVGIVVTDRTNVLNVCQNILNSASAQIFFNRKGLLQLLVLGTPTSDPVIAITDTDILFHSLSISARTEVVAATKIGYNKNYTVQTTLAGNVTPMAVTMFSEEWYTSSVLDSTVQADYKLESTPIQQDTCLLAKTDADALALSINNYFKVPRTVYSFVAKASLFSLKLGQAVTLTHNRFGLNNGKSGQVISLSPDWVAGTINVEVIV